MSDSHGRAPVTRRAVTVLLEHGAELLLHLGDVGGDAVVDALAVAAPADRADAASGTGKAPRPIEAHLVFGNTDFETPRLAQYASDLGITVDHPVGRLRLDGGELVFCHGHEPQPMRDAIERGARYLCHGHTHEAQDTRQGRTRIINPGALHRARQYTVALLCTETDTVTFYPVS